MAIALTTIFGNEIKIAAQPRHIHREYIGFPGTDGLAAMLMGSRGYQLVIRGTLRAATNILLQAGIDAIEQWLWAGANDYTVFGITYFFVVFDKFELVTDAKGKTFHLTSKGWVTCEFKMYARALI